ncbi:MAG: hypothetical protein M3439_10570 [Chloroflexota bacterium]|nr:hypothetical protein [Chloroflexota bacterium]
MSERDWSDLERRLDDALDALNDERAPDLGNEDDELSLLDTLRVVRRLREPVEPDAGFADRLVATTLAGASTASLLSYPNGTGEKPTATIATPVRLTSRRYRLVLSQIAAILRVVGVFVLAGMLSGVIVGGLGGRVAMRVSGFLYLRDNPGADIVTESSGEPVGQISLQGTLDLIVESAFSGIVIGLLLLIVAPWLPRSGWRRAAAFGLVLLAIVGGTVISPDNRDLRTLGPALLNITMFSTLIVIAGMLTMPIFAWLDRSIVARGGRLVRMGTASLRAVVVVLGGLGLVGAMLPVAVNAIIVPIHAATDPSWETIVLIPFILTCVITVLLTRVAVAFPNHLSALGRLRSESVTRFAIVALWLLTASGLLLLLTNTIRIATG